MIELPEPSISQEEKDLYLTNIFHEDLIKSISIHICSCNVNSFYNFSDFFLKNRLIDDNIKSKLKDMVISSLKQKNYSIAYVFNKTGLVICDNEEALNNSVWKSNLDFTKL